MASEPNIVFTTTDNPSIGAKQSVIVLCRRRNQQILESASKSASAEVNELPSVKPSVSWFYCVPVVNNIDWVLLGRRAAAVTWIFFDRVQRRKAFVYGGCCCEDFFLRSASTEKKSSGFCCCVLFW